jgi:hypothetical protein
MSVRQLSSLRFSLRVPGYVGLVVALVVVWGFGDALSTLWAIEMTGSIEGEANPWIKMLLAHDPALLLFFKAGVVAVAGGLLLWFREFVESVPGWRLWFGSMLTLGSVIVAGNTYVGVVTLI